MTDDKPPIPAPGEQQFPLAYVQMGSGPGLWQTIRASRLWLGTLACLVVAIVLTWLSVGRSGPQLVIHFDEGHGIKAGDTMRHRGIEIGQVTAVGLNSDLSGIDVYVNLDPASSALAREGSRFWIVRPRLSLTGVSGLETAVGAKYIAVDPGNSAGGKRKEFQGLSDAPADELDSDGIKIQLRAYERHGISVGAPVTYRGVDVGRVLNVELAPDALSIDLDVRIGASHRHLLQPHSKFWVNSGIGLDLGLTGIHLNAESLTSVAVGGIAFITPVVDDDEKADSKPVAENDRFVLHDKVDEDWLKVPGHSTMDTVRRWLGRDKPDDDKADSDK